MEILDSASGKVIFQLPHMAPLAIVAFSPNGRWIALGAASRHAVVFDFPTGKEVSRWAEDGMVRAVIFSRTSHWVATGSNDGTARVFEALTGREISRLNLGYRMWTVAFSPDTRWVAAATGDGAVQIFDAVARVRISDASARSKAEAFSAGGKFLAVVAQPEIVRIVQPATGKDISRFQTDSLPSASAFSPNQQKIAVGGNGTAQVFETISGRGVCNVALKGVVEVLTFSPDNRWLAIGTDKMAGIFDASSGKNLWELSRDTKAMAFSPDGTRLVAADRDASIRVFDPLTGKDIPGVAQFSWAGDALALSPDGRWMATFVDADKTTRVFLVANGKEIWRVAHNNAVTALAFSPDSRWLATAATGGEQQIFRLATHHEVSRMVRSGVPVAAAFDSASRCLFSSNKLSVTPSSDTNPISEIWLNRQLLYSEDLIQEACSRLTANLSPAQWNEYLGNEPYRKTCPNLAVPPGSAPAK